MFCAKFFRSIRSKCGVSISAPLPLTCSCQLWTTARTKCMSVLRDLQCQTPLLGSCRAQPTTSQSTEGVSQPSPDVASCKTPFHNELPLAALWLILVCRYDLRAPQRGQVSVRKCMPLATPTGSQLVVTTSFCSGCNSMQPISLL